MATCYKFDIELQLKTEIWLRIFVDYKKAYDWIDKLWEALVELGIPNK